MLKTSVTPYGLKPPNLQNGDTLYLLRTIEGEGLGRVNSSILIRAILPPHPSARERHVNERGG